MYKREAVRRTGLTCRICMRMSCMYALYVCLICMPYMYILYVCLMCMRMSYMYALYVCLTCMPYMSALHHPRAQGDGEMLCPHLLHTALVLLVHCVLLSKLYVCITCMPYMYASYVHCVLLSKFCLSFSVSIPIPASRGCAQSPLRALRLR